MRRLAIALLCTALIVPQVQAAPGGGGGGNNGVGGSGGVGNTGTGNSGNGIGNTGGGNPGNGPNSGTAGNAGGGSGGSGGGGNGGGGNNGSGGGQNKPAQQQQPARHHHTNAAAAYVGSAIACSAVSLLAGAAITGHNKKRELSFGEAYGIVGGCFLPILGWYAGKNLGDATDRAICKNPHMLDVYFPANADEVRTRYVRQHCGQKS